MQTRSQTEEDLLRMWRYAREQRKRSTEGRRITIEVYPPRPGKRVGSTWRQEMIEPDDVQAKHEEWNERDRSLDAWAKSRGIR